MKSTVQEQFVVIINIVWFSISYMVTLT